MEEKVIRAAGKAYDRLVADVQADGLEVDRTLSAFAWRVPDAWEIRERLMDISNTRAREAAGRVEKSVVMRDLAQHIVTKYGKRLAH